MFLTPPPNNQSKDAPPINNKQTPLVKKGSGSMSPRRILDKDDETSKSPLAKLTDSALNLSRKLIGYPASQDPDEITEVSSL